MELIHGAIPNSDPALPSVRLMVDRLTLAKRRWRSVAEDGREFGFDLTTPLRDGDHFFADAGTAYVIAQKYEPVLELRIGSPEDRPPLVPGAAASADCGSPSGAVLARVGWLIGNLHFQIEVTEEVIRVVDDPAVRQMFEREGIAFASCKRVFHPVSGGHQH